MRDSDALAHWSGRHQNSTLVPFPGRWSPRTAARQQGPLRSASRPRCPQMVAIVDHKPRPSSDDRAMNPSVRARTITWTRVARGVLLDMFTLPNLAEDDGFDRRKARRSAGPSSISASMPVIVRIIATRSRIVSSNPPGTSRAGGRTSKRSLRSGLLRLVEELGVRPLPVRGGRRDRLGELGSGPASAASR